MNEFKAFWTNYANFSDRTSIRGYWMAYLINSIVSLVLNIVVFIIPQLALLLTLYGLAAIIPGLAINVRRLRDANMHWGWLCISLIPLVGTLLLIVFLCRPTANTEGNQV